MKRAALVPLIVEAALDVVNRLGREDPVSHAHGYGYSRRAEAKELRLSLRTPQSLLPADGSSAYCIDVWMQTGKVCSIGWSSNLHRDYEVISFRRGPWIPILLGLPNES
jgi:hypothetical protein